MNLQFDAFGKINYPAVLYVLPYPVWTIWSWLCAEMVLFPYDVNLFSLLELKNFGFFQASGVKHCSMCSLAVLSSNFYSTVHVM